MADVQNKPVVSDDMQAGILAAMKRAESVPVRATLIDDMTKEEWLSEDVHDWDINAGSESYVDEIDNIDKKVENAA
ncbi:hypothetical protein [Pseudophaeobacter sp.]|jgi:hypothetical protein|uniref:hypothetical protein n=1 Tax=Pseudophaeobacter sp. TaxID=1971739 RepID=UPI0032D8CC81